MDWTRTQAKLTHTLMVAEDFELTTSLYRHDFQRAWLKLNGFAALSGVDIHDALRDPTNPRYRPFVDLLRGESDWTGDEAERLRIGTNDREYISQGIQSQLSYTANWSAFRNTVDLGLRIHHDEIVREHTEAEFDMISATPVRATEDRFERRNTGETVALSASLMNELSWKNRLIFAPGVRVEKYEMSLTDRLAETPSRQNSEMVILPGIGMWAQLVEGVGVLGGVHKGFSPVAPGQASAARSETSINYEAGLRWQTPKFAGEMVGFEPVQSHRYVHQSSGCDPNDIDTQFNAGEAQFMGLKQP